MRAQAGCLVIPRLLHTGPARQAFRERVGRRKQPLRLRRAGSLSPEDQPSALLHASSSATPLVDSSIGSRNGRLGNIRLGASVAIMPLIADKRKGRNFSLPKTRSEQDSTLRIAVNLRRFLHIPAGFSLADSHTESSLIRNSAEAERETWRSRVHSPGISGPVARNPQPPCFQSGRDIWEGHPGCVGRIGIPGC
jgi:hypothetical protein